MRNNVRQGLRVLRGIPEFLGKEIEGPAAIGPLATHIVALSGEIDRLDALVGEQDASTRAFRGAAQEAKKLSRKLQHEFVRPVVRMAKLLSPADPTLRSQLKLPRGSISYQALIAITMGVADRVEEHKAKFVAAGFAEDFVDKMRSTAEALNKALEGKAARNGRRAGATSGLVLEFARSREMVRMLDDMVAPLLEGTQRLAAWKAVSRFAREAKREEVEGQEETVSMPTASTPAATGGNASPDTHAA
ncbi:MAG: hypothetical protein H7066_05605 [Cytophagaceae bacterium]|nr:hypothetical protein [Gemmatimonadaceae bacterium]